MDCTIYVSMCVVCDCCVSVIWQGSRLSGVFIQILGGLLNALTFGYVLMRISATLDNLYNVHGRIVLNQHIVLLGWSEKSMFLLEEFCTVARLKGQGKHVVILAAQVI